MTPQPAPASAGEESEEDQQFRTIFQEIAGEVSTNFLKTVLKRHPLIPDSSHFFLLLLYGSSFARTWKLQLTSWETFWTEWSPNVSPFKVWFTASLSALALSWSHALLCVCVSLQIRTWTRRASAWRAAGAWLLWWTYPLYRVHRAGCVAFRGHHLPRPSTSKHTQFHLKDQIRVETLSVQELPLDWFWS